MNKGKKKHLEEAADMSTKILGTYNMDRPILNVFILS